MTARLVSAVALAAIVVLLGAAPAAAHGGPGGSDPPASNYRTVVHAIDPAVEGIHIRPIDAGARLELINSTGRPVVVLGYEGEPYLRIGPDGVFENRRSSATYLNRDRQARTDVPADADPDATPDWVRIDDGASASWHDHRAHWMGAQDPPSVAADPDVRQVVIEDWEVPIEVDGRPATVTGDLTWEPPPSPWPWAGAIVVGAGALAVVGMTRWWRLGLAVAAAFLVSASVLDVVGVWWATSERALAKSGELAAPVLNGTVLLGALAQLWRAPRDALLLVGAAAAGFGLLFGVTGLDWLTRSQVPTGIDPNLARATVVASCAAALGTFAVIAQHLPALAATRPGPVRPRQPSPATQPLSAELRRHRRWLIAGLCVVAVLFGLTATSGDSDTPDSRPTEGP